MGQEKRTFFACESRTSKIATETKNNNQNEIEKDHPEENDLSLVQLIQSLPFGQNKFENDNLKHEKHLFHISFMILW